MEVLIGDPDMGFTGVRDGWIDAWPDIMRNGTFWSWTLESGAAHSPPLHSMPELEVERSDDESWGRKWYVPSKVSKVS
jgi:hypothetical protein